MIMEDRGDATLFDVDAFNAMTSREQYDSARARYINLKADVLATEVEELNASLENLGTFHFFSEIDTSTVIRAILAMNRISRQRPEAEFTLVFNSPGGHIGDGFALFDFLQELKIRGHKVTTKILGTAASMAAVLVQAGDERVATPHSFLMIHEASSHARGKVSDLRETVDYVDRMQQKCIDILVDRSNGKLSESEIRNRSTKTEWFIDAQEALELGLIDRISI